MEVFEEKDFEFLRIVKRTTPRLKHILNVLYENSLHVEETTGELGRGNPSQTIFSEKKIISCEPKKKLVCDVDQKKNLFTKKDIEFHFKRNAKIKKSAIGKPIIFLETVNWSIIEVIKLKSKIFG